MKNNEAESSDTLKIVEGNKLIAEFDGHKICYVNNIVCIDKGHGFTYPIHEWAKYHTSWDWQIPVYSKLVAALKKSLKNEKFIDKNFELAIMYNATLQKNDCMVGWKILVENIEWYNQNSNK